MSSSTSARKRKLPMVINGRGKQASSGVPVLGTSAKKLKSMRSNGIETEVENGNSSRKIYYRVNQSPNLKVKKITRPWLRITDGRIFWTVEAHDISLSDTSDRESYSVERSQSNSVKSLASSYLSTRKTAYRRQPQDISASAPHHSLDNHYHNSINNNNNNNNSTPRTVSPASDTRLTTSSNEIPSPLGTLPLQHPHPIQHTQHGQTVTPENTENPPSDPRLRPLHRRLSYSSHDRHAILEQTPRWVITVKFHAI